MSFQDKDPLEKQDPSSESSESISDNEVQKAEKNLEHLRIQENIRKEEQKNDCDKSKPLVFPNQKGNLTDKYDLLNKPIAGSSGQQDLEANLYPDSSDICVLVPRKDKTEKSKCASENLETKRVDSDPDTQSMSHYIQSSLEPSTEGDDILNQLTSGPSRVMHPRLVCSEGNLDLDPENIGFSGSQEDKVEEVRCVSENIGVKPVDSDFDTQSIVHYIQSSLETSTEGDDILDQLNSGPGEVQHPRLVCSEGNLDLDPENIGFSSSKEVKADELRCASENIGVKSVERSSYITESTSPYIQSSPSEQSPEKVVVPTKSRKFLDYRKMALQSSYPKLSSSSKSWSFTSDSANTLSDVPEIVSEVATLSGEGSDYDDKSEDLQKNKPPSCGHALERQYSEASDSNISEIKDEYIPPLPTSMSMSASKASEEYDNRCSASKFQREAAESELANIRNLGLVGDGGFYRRTIDDISDSSDQNTSEPSAQGEKLYQKSEPIEVQTTLRPKRMQDVNWSLQQEPRCEKSGDMPCMSAEDVKDAEITGIKKEEKMQISYKGTGSSSEQRMPSTFETDSSSVEKVALDKLRPNIKTDMEEKGKVVDKNLRTDMQCSSESPEPKSTSSEERLHADSPEIKSSSESSKNDAGRKSWQKPGGLRSMQRLTMTSKDSVIVEKMDPTSPSINPSLEPIEFKDGSPEKTEMPIEKNVEGAATNAELQESSGQAIMSEAEGREMNYKVQEVERKVGKSKRPGGKMSNSPQSDEKLGSLQPKAAIKRPKKKSRPDKRCRQTRRTKHDSKNPFPDSFNPKQSDSSTSDQSDHYSPDEEETQL